MATITSDVFKFVAVRPVQLASDDETRIDVVRDPRAASSGELAVLVKAAAATGSPDAAMRRWKDVDLAPYRPLAAGRRSLVLAYTGIAADAPPPAAADLITAAGLAGVDPTDAAVLGRLWDALYIAHATGPDAGTRTDVPIAALRALHLLALIGDEPEPPRDLALRALRAKVAIAPEIDAALRPPPLSDKGTPAPATPATAPEPRPEDLAAASGLVESIRGAEDLRRRISTAAAVLTPTLSRGTVRSVGSFSQQQVTITGSRGIGVLVGADPGQHTTTVLDAAGITPDEPLAAAGGKLDVLLSGLIIEMTTRGADPRFAAALGQLVDLGGVRLPYPTTTAPAPSTPDPSTAPDVDVHGRITPLGIGDLKVVKQTLLAYEPGEVAYIENVLTGESRQRVVRALQRSQTTLLASTEQTQSTERDTTTTDRFELKREADQTIKEDMSVKAGLQVTASYGPIVAQVTGDFAHSTSKETAEKTSSDFVHDVVDRSIRKVEVKTTTTRTTTTLDENEQTDTHGVDNSHGDHHVVGVYRWVDKRYRAQVYNYGTRLMLEFVVPEPAAFWKAARTGLPVTVDATPPPPFINDLNLVFLPFRHGRLSAGDLNDSTYQQYAARYGATGVTPPPPEWRYVSALLEKDSLDDGKSIAATSKDFAVPDGYTLSSYEIAASVLWNNFPKLTVAVGDAVHNVIDHEDGDSLSALTTLPATSEGTRTALIVSPVNGPVPISVSAYDVHAFTVNVQGICARNPATYTAWQLQTYDKIAGAYEALQTVYDQKVAAAQQTAQDAKVRGQNPDINRATEHTELKKLCITMITGQHFSQFHAVTDPADVPALHPEVDVLEALSEGPIVQFFEQAFEWEQMTYLFYPYFWGRKAHWVNTTGLDDPDPLFTTFLTAGSCRVVVPVPVAYVDSVLYLLQSPATDLASKVWRGGDPPTLDSDLYVSLAQEFRDRTDDLAGATPEGDSWEFTLPTSLVWLQPDSTLPTFG